MSRKAKSSNTGLRPGKISGRKNCTTNASAAVLNPGHNVSSVAKSASQVLVTVCNMHCCLSAVCAVSNWMPWRPSVANPSCFKARSMHKALMGCQGTNLIEPIVHVISVQSCWLYADNICHILDADHLAGV